MRTLAAVAFIVGLGAPSVLAEAAFYHQQGNWIVASGVDACHASNRPTIEMNVSPVAAVRFTKGPDSPDILFEAFYWPGAFAEAQRTTLSIARAGDAEVVLPATATSDYSVKTDRSFTREEIGILRDQQVFAVKSPDVDFALGVDASIFNQVYNLLGFCASFLKSSGG
jgi:hypothetical protein